MNPNDRVAFLIGQLSIQNATLEARVEALTKENEALKAENEALKKNAND